MTAKIKIARISSVSMSFIHIQGFIEKISTDSSIQLDLISAKDHYWGQLEAKYPGVHKIPVSMHREISPLQDLKSLFELYRVFKKNKYMIIHSHTPKAGLLCAIAGFFARVPVRIHTFTGQRWVTISGPTRFFLEMLDRLVAKLNTHNFTDSPSQMDFLISEKIVQPSKISVIHKGSFGGIDLKRFNPERNDVLLAAEQIRKELNLTQDTFKILYLGRVTRDKGIIELIEAFKLLQSEFREKVQLLLVGPREQQLDPLPEKTLHEIENNKGIISVGFTNTPENYFYVCDVFTLPSYREGFGTVILEAAAMEKPSIGTNIYGVSDAIANGETGFLCKLHDVNDLYLKIKLLIQNKELREKLGKNGRIRVVKDFDQDILTNATITEYKKLIQKKLGYE